MKVNALQLFLRSLRSAVTAADGQSSLPADLEAVSEGLEPFAALDCGQFSAFLRRAEQYRSSGAVAVPSPASLGAEKVQTSLRAAASLADKISGADGLHVSEVSAARDKARQELEETLAAFLEPLAVNVALKADNKGFQAALKKAESRALADRLRTALTGISDEASLNAPATQEKLQAIVGPLEAAQLKAIAAKLAAPASGRSKDAVLAAIITHLTGIAPAAKKTARSRKPEVDPAIVQQEVVKLKALLDKSMTPGGLSSEEQERAIRELEPRSSAELQVIAKEIGLTKVGTKTDAILKKIREKLQEADRARESIQV